VEAPVSNRFRPAKTLLEWINVGECKKGVQERTAHNFSKKKKEEEERTAQNHQERERERERQREKEREKMVPHERTA
jgi:hypothetical protein